MEKAAATVRGRPPFCILDSPRSGGQMAIQTVGVVGAGTMGNGIAQVFAQAGFAVRVHDVATGALDRARQAIERSLARFVDKGKMQAADRDAALARLTMSVDLESLA